MTTLEGYDMVSPSKMSNARECLIVEQEELKIVAKIAQGSDLGSLMDFLQREYIDTLFTPALSDPTRGITIPARVEKKFASGHWIMATAYEGKVTRVVGCLAIVPSTLGIDVPPARPSEDCPISEGIPLREWGVSELREISTIVTDPIMREHRGVKGIGAGLLREATHLVAQEGKGEWGFITDSWVGGDMSGFLHHMVNKAYLQRPEVQQDVQAGLFDTLIRIFSDPKKRGKNGPPTVVYGIPYSKRDWDFFSSIQSDILPLRQRYRELEADQK